MYISDYSASCLVFSNLAYVWKNTIFRRLPISFGRESSHFPVRLKDLCSWGTLMNFISNKWQWWCILVLPVPRENQLFFCMLYCHSSRIIPNHFTDSHLPIGNYFVHQWKPVPLDKLFSIVINNIQEFWVRKRRLLLSNWKYKGNFWKAA